MDTPLLDIRDLSVHYSDGQKRLTAVDHVSFGVQRGKILALVGESGCGKTSIALAVLGLLPDRGNIPNGDIAFEGRAVSSLSRDEVRRLRGREISMIFQDPVSGLNPVLTVGQQVEEIIRAHTSTPKRELRHMALDALRRVGLPNPDELAKRYPYQLSGGMCQRVLIAIATVLNPKVIIADEPTSALDVTVQAGILQELARLRDERGISILLITHDLGVVAQMADEVVVMYAGRIAEQGATLGVLRTPRHPYTWSLLGTLPRIDRARGQLTAIRGAPPDPSELPAECAFVPRCRKAINTCRTQPSPELIELAPGQRAACYNPVVHQEQ